MNNKKMPKVKVGIFLVTILMVTLISSQTFENINILPSEVLELDFLEQTSEPNEFLGAVCSSVTEDFTKYINFGGVDIWKSVEFTEVENFVLYLTEPNAIVDFGSLSGWELTEASELITLGENPNVFETYETNISVIGDSGLVLQENGVQYMHNSLTYAMHYESDVSVPDRTRIITTTAGTFYLDGVLCNTSLCGDSFSVFALEGVYPDEIYRAELPSEFDNLYLFYGVVSGSDNFKYMIDSNGDGLLTLDQNLNIKKTSSFEKDALIFADLASPCRQYP